MTWSSSTSILEAAVAFFTNGYFYIYKKDSDKGIRASCFEPFRIILYFNLLFLQKCVIN